MLNFSNFFLCMVNVGWNYDVVVIIRNKFLGGGGGSI